MNAIAPISTAPTTTLAYAEMERLAAAIAKSGLFGMKTPEQALVLMSIAQAEGRHPALAARDYDVIQGRPAKKAEAMQRDFLIAGGAVEWHQLDDMVADATFSHPQGGKARINWDMQRAATAGLGARDSWKKFPRQMLRSRCVSEGVRTVWPLATSGMYEPGEAADISPPRKEPPHAGPTIEAKAEPHDERMARLAPTYDTPEAEQDDGNPEYPFATSKGGQVYRTGSEYLEAWRRLIEACKRTGQLNKIATAGEMNRGAIAVIGAFDPGAAAEVSEMIAAALPDEEAQP
jgi:hypothetical protein